MADLYEYKIDDILIKRFDSQDREKGVPGYPVSTNGSFFYWDKNTGKSYSAGPVMLKGFSQTGVDRAYKRGAVAVFNGGVLVRRLIDYSKSPMAADIRWTFLGLMPSAFMGGGFMLIENSVPVSMKDLIGQQIYDPKDGKQLQENNHILIGNRGNDAYLVIALGLHYSKIVNRLQDYTQLCLFDGGQAFWARTPEVTRDGTNYGKPEQPYFALGVKGNLSRKS